MFKETIPANEELYVLNNNTYYEDGDIEGSLADTDSTIFNFYTKLVFMILIFLITLFFGYLPLIW
jgi:hypothetical protein